MDAGEEKSQSGPRSDRNYGVRTIRGPFVRLGRHELSCDDEDELISLTASMQQPLAADLFCGAGGLSLGLQQAGFEVVLGVDTDSEALETHRAHHPGLSVNWDLGDPEVVERIANLVKTCGITLLAGAPPCQPFSRAGRSMIRDLVQQGRRHAHDRRRDLWESFLNIVELSAPPAVVMENVPDMALDRGMVILRAMVERLEDLGYSVEERVVDTWRYGVPQMRQRLILVALADGVGFRWPAESDQQVTVDMAIGDLPPVEGGWRPMNGDGTDPVASGWAAYGSPRTTFQAECRVGVPADQSDRLYDHITRPVREDDALAFAKMNPETRYSELDESLKRYRDDIFDDKYKRLDPHDFSRTITAHIAKDGYWYIHPYQERTLTIREAARLQTFPDWFRFAGPPSSSFRQIGNAVPVKLAAEIGSAILRSMESPRRAEFSTAQVSEKLAHWFRNESSAATPWLSAESRWTVIQAELLWSRIGGDQIRAAWAAVRSLDTPDKTLRALPLLRAVATRMKREARLDAVVEAARWFLDNPETLAASAVADDLAKAPHVTTAIADLACRVVPGEAEDPILAGFGVLRVAARFHGEDVNRRNRGTDGRLAVARMVGGAESSHHAHLALIRLAADVCGPQSPQCDRCPLSDWCREAAVRRARPVS